MPSHTRKSNWVPRMPIVAVDVFNRYASRLPRLLINPVTVRMPPLIMRITRLSSERFSSVNAYDSKRSCDSGRNTISPPSVISMRT